MQNRMLCILALLAASAVPLVAEEPFLEPSVYEADDSETLVEIPDAALHRAVEVALDKAPGDPISRGEMATLEELTAPGVRQLTGVEHAVNLRDLFLFDGAIADVSPLAEITSLVSLRLDGNAIVDISPLESLTSLSFLWLHNNEIADLTPLADLAALTRLDLYNNAIADVSPLAGMTSLTYLRLGRNLISNVSPLVDLTALTTLDLSANTIADLSPLTGMTALTRLYLNGNAIADVSPLAGMTSLTTLWLPYNLISDLSPLGELTALTELGLDNNLVSDVSALAGMTALTRLSLGRNAISDVSPLAGMTGLTRLWLAGNAISDVSPLAMMTSLTELALGRNAVADLSPLAGMTALTKLWLDNNAIADLSPLTRMASLTTLWLPYNLISDLSPLAEMTSLTELWLMDNLISDLSPLAGMTALTTLHLEGNLMISDLSPLAGMTALTELHAVRNAISDLSPLAGMTALTGLSLRANAISDLSPLARLTALTELTLGNNAISDVSPLAGLPSLARLELPANTTEDVSPLVANEGLGPGVSVDLRGNPLRPRSTDKHIPALRQRGVEVLFDTIDLPQLPQIADVELRRAAEWQLHILRRQRYVEGDDVLLAGLDASNRDISDLTGIETVVLHDLHLDHTKVTDITPLLGYEVSTLTLSYTAVEDWTPLASLGNLYQLALDGNALNDLPAFPLPSRLRGLYLTDNFISDITSLADLHQLIELQLTDNSIDSLASLSRMRNLQYLHAGDNQVADLSPLNFSRLRELHMRNNAVRDIAPLLSGEELLVVDVRRNPLADDALAVLDTLRERRVTVLAGETVPYFPAASGMREGFVRIVNRSNRNGHVFIEAVDDAGVRAGPVRLRVLRRRAIHFDSADLEHGMAARRLDGIGPPTAGDWRLSVISALDIEVLSYVRTEDGFFTTMHDVVPDAMAPFFNPGDARQRSILRTVNMEAEPAKWTTGGYDDRGRWRPMAGSMLVRPQHALTLTGDALEDMHGLGNGEGRWRLRVRGFPWFAMSLLENPTGHLTNLSTVPDNATPLADGRTMHRLPLFPVADGSREGIVRVINRSYSSGEVTIEAVDDAGTRSGPVQLTVAPRRAVELSATDLEHGNVEKGLAGRLGVGEGDWRLEVASELELMVLSYVQTADGFLASLHDMAPVAEDGGHRVVFFKPGSNRWQVSKLRLVNDGERAASVRIAGIDDRGVDSGMVTLTVPAGSALTFTSAELETGSERLGGSLGDGYGQWRLRVHSDEPIAVMSLLETQGGLLANMSTGTAD